MGKNEKILSMAQLERYSKMSRIRNRLKNWIGHILRGNSLMKIALEGRMEGKNGR